MRSARLILLAAVALPCPVLAREAAVATRAGRAAEVVQDLARQTGTSIVIADAAIARRPVRAIRGRMDAAEAIRTFARASGARAVAVGPNAWRLESAPKPRHRALFERRKTPPSPSSAPPPEAPPPPIVVLATKRDLTLDQVPGQVSILDGRALTVGGVGGTEKISRGLATVTSTHLGSGRNKLFIRGIADSSFVGPTQATVGQYLGDLRLSYNAPDPDLRLSDMDRVEVLEGPQGTLYGAGSLGGIIRLVPNAPQPGITSLSGMLGGSLTQSGDPGADTSLTANIPLDDEHAAIRFTVDSARQGGYIDKPTLGRRDVNQTNIIAGRIATRYEFDPEWSIELAVLGQDIDSDDSQYADRDGPPLTSSARVREGSEADYLLGQFVLAGKIGALQLRSTTGLVRQTLQERYDASDAQGPARLFAQRNHTRMFANETRIWMPETNGLGWMLGTSYTHNDTVLSRRFRSGEQRSTTTGVRNTVDEATLFAEASLRLKSSIVATAGGRLTWTWLDGEGEDIMPQIAMDPQFATAYAAETADRRLTTFLPSFALHSEISPATLVFVRYQEGFRPGGLAIESQMVRRFRDDRTQTFEIGARHGGTSADPFDLALSLSYTRWKDIQADYIDPAGLPSTANIGDGRVWSASITGGWAVTPALRLEAGATLNESKIDSAPTVMLSRARQVPNIAHFAGRTAIVWNYAIDDRLTFTANGWASYVGRSRLGIGPELGELQGDYLDSGIDLRVGSDFLGLSLGIVNLANSRGNRFSLGTPFSTGQDQITPLRPRTIRLGLDSRF